MDETHKAPDGLITDPTDGVQLARPARAARLLGMTSRQMYRWIQDGKVRVRYAVGGAVLVEVASLFTQQKPETARVGKHASDGDLQPAA